MSTRIYVGNIPFTCTEQDLRDAFGAVGSVEEVHMVTDRETGRARGFAFVAMDDAGAQTAIAELNGTNLGGRTIVVNQAKEREGRSNGRNGAHRPEQRGRERDW